MAEQAHPISLQQVVFTRSVVIALPEHTPPEGGVTMCAPDNQINVVPIEGQLGWYQAIMQTKLNESGDSKYPYIIDMQCLGQFFADESLTPEEAHRGVTITAHSVLYGAIREAVSWLTGRQPFGTLTLGLSVLRSKAQEKKD